MFPLPLLRSLNILLVYPRSIYTRKKGSNYPLWSIPWHHLHHHLLITIQPSCRPKHTQTITYFLDLQPSISHKMISESESCFTNEFTRLSSDQNEPAFFFVTRDVFAFNIWSGTRSILSGSTGGTVVILLSEGPGLCGIMITGVVLELKPELTSSSTFSSYPGANPMLPSS